MSFCKALFDVASNLRNFDVAVLMLIGGVCYGARNKPSLVDPRWQGYHHLILTKHYDGPGAFTKST